MGGERPSEAPIMDTDWTLRVEAAKLAMEAALGQNMPGADITQPFLRNYIAILDIISGKVDPREMLTNLSVDEREIKARRP